MEVLVVQAGDTQHSETERIEQSSDIDLGSWYWLKQTIRDPDYRGGVECDGEILCCVMHVGSNYIQLESPLHWYVAVGSGRQKWFHSEHRWRIHFNDFHRLCRLEPDPGAHFKAEVAHLNSQSAAVLQQIQDICARLGVSPVKALTLNSSDRALAVMSNTTAVDDYKIALERAKTEDLPKLFAEHKRLAELTAENLKAETLPMKAMVGDLSSVIGRVEDRIFQVSLYAGLKEQAIRVQDGPPASHADKLHVFQGMLFMDEECLVNYTSGGMEFGNIGEFNGWLLKPENLTRILLFPRTLVAFQVRRYAKAREAHDLKTAWINFHLEQDDKRTFLYLRNGDQVWMIDTEVQFGHYLFPSRDDFDYGGEYMVETGGDHKIMPVREYEDRKRQAIKKARYHRKRQKLYRQWKKAHPEESGFEAPDGLRDYYFGTPSVWDWERWEPLGWESVWLDDVNAEVADRIKHHNRICTILQGLFDRSEILHPHPPVKLFEANALERYVTLVYDKGHTLYDGDAPDITAYFEANRAQITDGHVTMGQHAYWYSKLPVRQGDRRNNYREYKVVPYGNPGPDELATIDKWHAKSQKAEFRWERERARRRWRHESETIPCKILVPRAALFSLTAYQPGDYKQFFNDPRTRVNYLKWAHRLLTAEEWHNGNVDSNGHRKPAAAPDADDRDFTQGADE